MGLTQAELVEAGFDKLSLRKCPNKPNLSRLTVAEQT